jgi:hypothetical protein
MLNVAAATPAGAVLDSTFFPYAFAQLRSLPGTLVEVHCRCPREVAVARYTARSPTRHAGHLDADRQPVELWNDQNTRPTGIAPAIVVDTTAPVDVAAVVRRINDLARAESTICPRPLRPDVGFAQEQAQIVDDAQRGRRHPR